jgi:hypothetical protein
MSKRTGLPDIDSEIDPRTINAEYYSCEGRPTVSVYIDFHNKPNEDRYGIILDHDTALELIDRIYQAIEKAR